MLVLNNLNVEAAHMMKVLFGSLVKSADRQIIFLFLNQNICCG